MDFLPLSNAQLRQIHERGYTYFMFHDGIRVITYKDVVIAKKDENGNLIPQERVSNNEH